jgi:polyisoprenoid-binding protein YceI
MNIFARTVAFAVALGLTTAAVGQEQTFTVDPGSSRVTFTLRGTAHEVHGTFHITSGIIQFDPHAAKISGSVIVSAASGESGDKGRDKDMHTEVLDVAHYADVTFQPQNYQGTLAASGDSTIQVSGIFTLHGTPHDITVPMQIHVDGAALSAKGSLIVPYVKWGLKDPSIFILKVAKDVHVDLNLVGQVRPSS